MTIGVGILSFNRPAYLRRLLASLEAQTDLIGADFWLFQDGAVNRYSGLRYAQDADIQACLKLFARSRLDCKWSVVHERNVGIAINAFEALEELAGNYERVMLLEDDVVLSPHWLRLVRLLYTDLAERPHVFSVSPGFLRSGDDEAAVVYGWPHHWCECFLSERWREIRAYYLEDYYPHVAECDYLQRDSKAIDAAYARLGVVGGPDGLARSQDGGRELAMQRAGMTRAKLVVNRAIGIGQEGLHFTPWHFHALGFDQPGPFVHPGDAAREGFVWPA
jgi:hypothetical protein